MKENCEIWTALVWCIEIMVVGGFLIVVLLVWEPQNPVASLLFIPATMVHPLFYEPLLLNFANEGFAVIGLHPAGHSKSPREGKRYTVGDIIQNGSDAITFALEHFAVPVIVMGSCQGGIAAMALASTDKRISAVFSHNIMLSELPGSIGITRFPLWLRHAYNMLMVTHPGEVCAALSIKMKKLLHAGTEKGK